MQAPFFQFFTPIDARPICAFRVCFGLLMAVHALRRHVHGMYERAVLQPAFRFPYEVFGIELTPALPQTPTGTRFHLAVIAFASLGIAVGVIHPGNIETE